MGDVLGFFTDNWEMILLVLAGGWLVKIRVAVKSVQKLLVELREDKAVLESALADKTISTVEAQEIARELGETLVALHEATTNVMSLLPAKWKAKVPVAMSK